VPGDDDFLDKEEREGEKEAGIGHRFSTRFDDPETPSVYSRKRSSYDYDPIVVSRFPFTPPKLPSPYCYTLGQDSSIDQNRSRPWM
jgi:hypothetical protein